MSFFSFYDTMNEVIRVLCTGTTLGEITTLSATVKHKIESHLTTLLEEEHSNLFQPPQCLDCHSNCFTTDYVSGDCICQECGRVLVDHLLEETNSLTYTPSDTNMYSDQRNFRSYMTFNGKQVKKVNHQIEKKLSIYTRDGVTTTDYYKDEQREKVYEALDVLKLTTSIPHGVIEEVKLLFNHYRSLVTRIHKLPKVVAALFVIVLQRGVTETK